MDNSEIEKVTKSILSESKLGLTNPCFDENVMKKIESFQRRKTMIHNMVISFLIFITSDALILSFLKIMRINIVGIGSKVGFFIQNASAHVHNGFSNMESLIIPYFLIIIIFIFLLNKILKLQYSDDFADITKAK